jgi:pilus assembly protein CpaF
MELDQFIKTLNERRKKSASTADGALSLGKEVRAEPATVVRTQLAPSVDTEPRLPSKSPGREALEELKHRIHTLLVERLNPEELNALSDERQRIELRRLLGGMLDAENHPLSHQQKQSLIAELLDDVLGFGPLERLLRDPTVSDILINNAHSIYVERNGVLEEETGIGFRDNQQLLEIIQRIVSQVGRRVNESSPMVDARLPDGSRFNAIVPPLALDGPMVSIRRFGKRPLRIADLLALKALTPEMCVYLEAAVKARLNILVSGGTGSGKTTLLNALSSFIPPTERIITIEDAAELQMQQHHVGRLEARPPNLEGKGEVTIRDLVRNALRMRPDRIVIGECRGAEALDMLQAMNTGHEGSLTTLHANSPRAALGRLETMILFSQIELPLRAMRQQIASAINVIIQVERLPGGPRRITNITEVTGMEADILTLQELFVFREMGMDSAGKAYGEFVAAGLASHYHSRIQAAGITLPPDLFRQRVLLQA